MNSSASLGGITLIVAAIVWLMIFVPGYTKRSQVRESASLVRAEQKQIAKVTPLTLDQRMSRLINTQRGFSVLFALFLLGAIASFVAGALNPGWFGAGFSLTALALASLLIQRAAGSQASKLATQRHRSKLEARFTAQRAASKPVVREWTPNPLPAPLSRTQPGEMSQPLADVIAIQKPRNTLSGTEIDAILARRRAI
jgi:hypothetical protein